MPAIPGSAERSRSTRFELVRATGVHVHWPTVDATDGVARCAREEAGAGHLHVAIHHVHLCDVDIGWFNAHCHWGRRCAARRDRAALQQALSTVPSISLLRLILGRRRRQAVAFAERAPARPRSSLLLPRRQMGDWIWYRFPPALDAHRRAGAGARSTRAIRLPAPVPSLHFVLTCTGWSSPPRSGAGQSTPFWGSSCQESSHTLVGGQVVHRHELHGRKDDGLCQTPDFAACSRSRGFTGAHFWSRRSAPVSPLPCRPISAQRSPIERARRGRSQVPVERRANAGVIGRCRRPAAFRRCRRARLGRARTSRISAVDSPSRLYAIRPTCLLATVTFKMETAAIVQNVFPRSSRRQVGSDLDAASRRTGLGQVRHRKAAITGFCWGGRVVWQTRPTPQSDGRIVYGHEPEAGPDAPSALGAGAERRCPFSASTAGNQLYRTIRSRRCARAQGGGVLHRSSSPRRGHAFLADTARLQQGCSRGRLEAHARWSVYGGRSTRRPVPPLATGGSLTSRSATVSASGRLRPLRTLDPTRFRARVPLLGSGRPSRDPADRWKLVVGRMAMRFAIGWRARKTPRTADVQQSSSGSVRAKRFKSASTSSTERKATLARIPYAFCRSVIRPHVITATWSARTGFSLVRRSLRAQ